MAKTFSNIVVKAKDQESVLQAVRKHRFFEEPKFSCYVSKSLNGYIFLFPSLGFQFHFPFTKYLSKTLGTLALGGFVYKSSEISFGVFSKGDLVYRYLWQFEGGFGHDFPERPAAEGDKRKLLELLPDVQGGESEFLRLILEDKPKKEELFSDILEFLGIPNYLTKWSNRQLYLLEEGEDFGAEVKSPDNLKLVKISTSEDLAEHPFLADTGSKR